MTRNADKRTYPNRAKKRTAKAKAKRLEHEAKRNRFTKKAKASVGECRIRMLNDGDGALAFGIQRGVLGHPTQSVVKIPGEAVAGALEDQKELGTIIFKVGTVALAHLVGYNLAYGVDGLAEAVATWAGLDVAQLKADAALEKMKAESEAHKTELEEYREVQPAAEPNTQEAQGTVPEQLELPFDVSDAGGAQ